MIIKTLREMLASSKGSKSNQKVLLISENDQKSRLSEKILNDKQLNITVVHEKELELLVVKRIKPNLIILDSTSNIAKTSQTKRLNFLAKLKIDETTKSIPILVITDNQDDLSVVDYYANKVDCCLIEPISSKELIKEVKILINK